MHAGASDAAAKARAARLSEARAAFTPGAGREACRAYAGAIDALLGELWRPDARASLVALGGYGRGELGPHSDLDLLFLVDDGVDDRSIAPAVEAVLYPLWDLRLDVGHAVRAVEATLALARDDLTACTALLDARLIAGTPAPFERLAGAARRRLFSTGADRGRFIARLREERARRLERFGDSVFLLEPNLKSGQGGLRDLLIALWAVKARFGVDTLEDLASLDGPAARAAADLVAARDFLWTVRNAAHLHARRRQDHLVFEIQEAIAPAFVQGSPRIGASPLAGQSPASLPEGSPRPGAWPLGGPSPASLVPDAKPRRGGDSIAPAVEALMRRYYLHARAVVHAGDALLERAGGPGSAASVAAPVSDPLLFERRPVEMLRAFSSSLEQGAPLSLEARDRIAEALLRRRGRRFSIADPASASLFLRLLCDARDARSPSVLEQMHACGLLGALVPEFTPCTAHVQHDVYHVYTVDQHLLYAVAWLKALARGEHAETRPLATQVMRDLARPVSLYLATLLHDAGKPLAGDHSRSGARLAASAAARLKLDKADARRAEALVLDHLLLSRLAQRRDVDDARMVAALARRLGDLETLRQLYVMTVADTAMTAPGNLTDWKAALLDDLFLRAAAALGSESPRAAPPARTRARALAMFGGFPPELVARLDASGVARLARLLATRRAGEPALDVRHRARGAADVAVACDDAPALLSRVTGVLSAHGLDILSARIATRVAPSDQAPGARGEARPAPPGEGGRERPPPGEALDLFTVRGRAGPPPRARDFWDGLAADLARVLRGEVDVESLLRDRRRRDARPLMRRVLPRVPTEIEIDNDVSEGYTVIDVFTQDRLGLLHAITRTLAQLSLDIGLARVSTEAERAADAFYVRERGGGKILDAARLAEVTGTLARDLERFHAEVAS